MIADSRLKKDIFIDDSDFSGFNVRQNTKIPDIITRRNSNACIAISKILDDHDFCKLDKFVINISLSLIFLLLLLQEVIVVSSVNYVYSYY